TDPGAGAAQEPSTARPGRRPSSEALTPCGARPAPGACAAPPTSAPSRATAASRRRRVMRSGPRATACPQLPSPGPPNWMSQTAQVSLDQYKLGLELGLLRLAGAEAERPEAAEADCPVAEPGRDGEQEQAGERHQAHTNHGREREREAQQQQSCAGSHSNPEPGHRS